MKKYQIINGGSLRNHRVISTPTSVSSISFDDLYDEISGHWEEKSRKLQARRWRKIKHQLA